MSPEDKADSSAQGGQAGRSGSGARLLLEKLVYPVLSSVTSAVTIGLLLGVFIDGRMAKWQKLSDFQLEREKEAHILLYDAFTRAELDLSNYEQGHIDKNDKLSEELDDLINEESRQVAYISENLDAAYEFVHKRMLTRMLLVEKERRGEDVSAQVLSAGEDIDAGREALLVYMKLWHAGQLDKAEAALQPYVDQRAGPGDARAYEEVTALLQEEEAAGAAKEQ